MAETDVAATSSAASVSTSSACETPSIISRLHAALPSDLARKRQQPLNVYIVLSFVMSNLPFLMSNLPFLMSNLPFLMSNLPFLLMFAKSCYDSTTLMFYCTLAIVEGDEGWTRGAMFICYSSLYVIIIICY